MVVPAAMTIAMAGFALVPIADAKSSRHKSPISGPELVGPVQTPGSPPVPELEIKTKNQPDFAFGAFQRGYFLTALDLALPRAESGDPAAQTLIAEIYSNGFGVARDRKEGAKWYEFAAKAGGREAQFAWGNILLRGKIVPQDKTAGESYLTKAAKAGHPRAAFNLAQIIVAKRPTWASFKKALPYYTLAAKAGVADAQYALANMYAEAQGVQFNDDKSARQWLEKAAKNGLESAQVDMAIWLANGRGGEKDIVSARRWFTRAAAQGNVVAQNRLARIFAYGLGTNIDKVQAGAWHILSKRAGFKDTELDRVFQAYEDIDRKRALEAANQLSSRLRGV